MLPRVKALIGKQIESYRIASHIATGGVGNVYRANSPKYQFRLAVKILKSERKTDKQAAADIGREFEICKNLHHAGILKYLDFGTYQMRPYLVMEYFSGTSIKKLLKDEEEKKHIQGRSNEIIKLMAEIVEYLHSKNIVHRDIKADNFLYDPKSHAVKLIDFSTAVSSKQSVTSFLDFMKKQPIVGTPSYIAPEQIERKSPTPSIDIYSFGAMLFEIFAGQPPFVSEDQNELLNMVLQSPPPLLRKINPDVTMDFSQLVNNMLNKDPDARPLSMTHFLSTFSKISVFR